jgi:hypothetical protein
VLRDVNQIAESTPGSHNFDKGGHRRLQMKDSVLKSTDWAHSIMLVECGQSMIIAAVTRTILFETVY